MVNSNEGYVIGKSGSKVVSKSVPNDKIKEKDGGYGWVIVLASFIVQFIGDGVSYTFGVFLVYISQEFPDSGKSAPAWIASIKIAITNASGPLGSILVNKFGLRFVSVLGSILAAVGFTLSYFAQSVEIMYATVGVLGGLGFGLLYLPAMVSVPQYFTKRRSLAMGIAVCGSGSGTLVFEWVFETILLHYEWRQGMLFAGGIILISAFFGFLYLPVRTGNVENVDQRTQLMEKTEDSCCSSIASLLDWSLLKNPLFIIFSISNMLTSIGYNVPYIYFPDIEKSLTGGSRSTLLGFLGGANVFGRIMLGLLGDRKFINRQYLFNILLAVSGLATISSPHLNSIMWLRAYAILYGIAMGACVSLKGIILVDLLGLARLTDAFGLLLLLQSLGFLIGAPIVGFLFDNYGRYDYGFYFAGSTIFLSGVILFIIPCLKPAVMLSTQAEVSRDAIYIVEDLNNNSKELDHHM